MQINHGRIAAKTSKYRERKDITVFDMKSGEVILSCNQDLNLYARQSFLLRKNKLLLADCGMIVSAVFWV